VTVSLAPRRPLRRMGRNPHLRARHRALVSAVPATLSAALSHRAYYFVPLAIATPAKSSSPRLQRRSRRSRRLPSQRGLWSYGSRLPLHPPGRGPFRSGLRVLHQRGPQLCRGRRRPESFASLLVAGEAQVRGEPVRTHGRPAAAPWKFAPVKRISSRVSTSAPATPTSSRPSLTLWRLHAVSRRRLRLPRLREREYPLLAAPPWPSASAT